MFYFCSKCGTKSEDNATVCQKCGNPLADVAAFVGAVTGNGGQAVLSGRGRVPSTGKLSGDANPSVVGDEVWTAITCEDLDVLNKYVSFTGRTFPRHHGEISLLMYACQKNAVKSIAFLLANEAPLDLRDNLGRTALHYALANTTYATGVGVPSWEEKKPSGRPLFWCWNNTSYGDGQDACSISLPNIEAIQLLVRAGASLEVENSHGFTPLAIAMGGVRYWEQIPPEFTYEWVPYGGRSRLLRTGQQLRDDVSEFRARWGKALEILQTKGGKLTDQQAQLLEDELKHELDHTSVVALNKERLVLCLVLLLVPLFFYLAVGASRGSMIAPFLHLVPVNSKRFMWSRFLVEAIALVFIPILLGLCAAALRACGVGK